MTLADTRMCEQKKTRQEKMRVMGLEKINGIKRLQEALNVFIYVNEYCSTVGHAEFMQNKIYQRTKIIERTRKNVRTVEFIKEDVSKVV